MIILGIGGILGDAASAILKDGALVAAIEESKLVRRRTHWGGHGELPEHSIAKCLELAGATPQQVDAVAIVRPIPESDFHLKLRAQLPREPHRGARTPPGACRLGLLPLSVRGSHGAHARPRRRPPLRLALAGARRRA